MALTLSTMRRSLTTFLETIAFILLPNSSGHNHDIWPNATIEVMKLADSGCRFILTC